MTLEDRLRMALHAAADTITDEDPPPTLAASAPKPRRRLLLAFAAGVAVVAMLGLVVWLAPGSERQEPPPLDSTDSLSLDWSTVDLLPSDYMAGPFAIGPGGMIAQATQFKGSSGTSSLALVSPNGVDWSKLEVRGLGGQRLVGYRGGYVSYGRYQSGAITTTTPGPPSDFPRPAAWTSPDGHDWTVTLLPLPSPDEAISDIVSYEVSDLAATESGMVAVGIEFDETVPDTEGTHIIPTRRILWATNPTGEWELVDYPMENPEAVAAGPAGIIVTDRTDTGTGIWNKTGDGWTQLTTLDDPNLAHSVVGNDTGYVLSGGSVWFSPDGSDWTQVKDSTDLGVVQAGSHWFVSAGRQGDRKAVWWSKNGLDWVLAATPDHLGVAESAFVSYVGVTDRAIVVSGQTGVGLEAFRSGNVNAYMAVGTLRP